MLRFSALVKPPPSCLEGTPGVVRMFRLGETLEVWLAHTSVEEVAEAMLCIADSGSAVLRVGLLDGRTLSPIAFLSRPNVAEADPLLRGEVVVECPECCSSYLPALSRLAHRLVWRVGTRNRCLLVVPETRVSEFFHLGLRVVKPFRAPP